MKLKATIALMALSTTVFSAEFNRPNYRPGEYEFKGSSQFNLYSAEYDQENKSTDNKTNFEESTTHFTQEAEFGVTKELSVLLDLNYVTSQEMDSTSKVKSTGLESVAFGASYRVNSLITLPFVLDAYGKFTPSLSNKLKANTNDDGTPNSGGHHILVGARGSMGDFYADYELILNMEQTIDNATTEKEAYTVDMYTTMNFVAGAYFNPMESLAISVEGQLTRIGEREYNYNPSGSQTDEAHYQYGFNVQGYYDVLSNLSANIGLKYLLGSEYEVDASTDQTVKEFSASAINIGATYKF